MKELLRENDLGPEEGQERSKGHLWVVREQVHQRRLQRRHFLTTADWLPFAARVTVIAGNDDVVSAGGVARELEIGDGDRTNTL